MIAAENGEHCLSWRAEHRERGRPTTCGHTQWPFPDRHKRIKIGLGRGMVQLDLVLRRTRGSLDALVCGTEDTTAVESVQACRRNASETHRARDKRAWCCGNAGCRQNSTAGPPFCDWGAAG